MSHAAGPPHGAATLPTSFERPGAAGLEAPPPAQHSAASHAEPPRPRRERHPSLDGLRGIAALVVVVFHVLLVSPVFDSPSLRSGPDDASWWLTHTPLGLVWAGPQAVFVFFVLSGFVLTLPASSIRWRAYYPQRLVRLYLPVWASLVLAVALVSLFPRESYPGLSDWWDRRQPTGSPLGAVRDGLLLLGTRSWNSPLWSLRYEVLFSLLLPVYLLGARVLPRWGLARFGVLLLALAVSEATGRQSLTYMLMFAFGVLLAVERERLAELAARVDGLGRSWAWPALGVVCALLLNGELVLLVRDDELVRGGVMAMQLAGASLLIVLALHWVAARTFLSRPWVQWVGLRSFALYLVHEPIVLSLVAIAPRVHVLGHLLVGLPLSLVVASLFYRAVEVPAHRLSRFVGERAGGRFDWRDAVARARRAHPRRALVSAGRR